MTPSRTILMPISMVDKIFIDTWGWLCLRNQREPRHFEVAELYTSHRTQGGSVYTSDYALDETFTLLFKRLPFVQARDSMRSIEQAIEQGYLFLERITPARFESAKMLRLKLDDKPDISFTDLTTMVVMAELGIKLIMSADAHFMHVGLDFQCVP